VHCLTLFSSCGCCGWCLCQVDGGAFPTDPEARQIKFFERRLGRVFLHPSSCCFSSGNFPTGWLIYSELVQTAKAYVREASMVPIYPLLLFGGEGSARVEGIRRDKLREGGSSSPQMRWCAWCPAVLAGEEGRPTVTWKSCQSLPNLEWVVYQPLRGIPLTCPSLKGKGRGREGQGQGQGQGATGSVPSLFCCLCYGPS
jgi:hypothetical protein